MSQTSSDRRKLERLYALLREYKRRYPWEPDPGNKPQCQAYESTADIIGFGGAAGGGKTDLAIGKALTQHRKTLVVRTNGTEHVGMQDRIAEILGTRAGYNGKDNIWRTRDVRRKCEVQIEFGSTPNPGDEKKYQGRPHDLIVYDEAATQRESAVRFLMTWNRTTTPGQRCQILLTFNPPTDAEGQWIVEFFAPWIDKRHPLYPTPYGELRYAAMVPDGNGRVVSVWVDDARPFVMRGTERVYEFDASEYDETDIIVPKSRTFIPSRVTDNRYLMGTAYMATLQSLPEPLRSQMLKGDFEAGMQDDAMQVIPSAWVDAAMARWKPLDKKPRMDSLGVDVARGGQDNTIIARRHGWWFDELLVYPGKQTPDGPTVAGLVIAATRDKAPQHIDVVGVGASPYDFLRQAGQHVIGINGAEGALGKDKSGRLDFANLRSQLWWRLREALDPDANNGIALPPDTRLRMDLCAPVWRLQGRTIYVESRDDIIKRIGRSPDYGSAVILALLDTPRVSDLPGQGTRNGKRREYDPLANV